MQNNLEARGVVSNSVSISRIKSGSFFEKIIQYLGWENQWHTWSSNSSFHSNNNNKPIKMIAAIVPAIVAIKLGLSSPMSLFTSQPENKLKVTWLYLIEIYFKK